MASDSEISCANDPNFAVIYSFLKTFGKLNGLDIPTITKLQEFIENTQEVLDPLKELHLRLLRRALKSVQRNRWERSMIKFCHQQGHHQEAWEIERFSYKKASTQVKLKVLKLLLEYQFTCHTKFKTVVNAISCKDLRLDPIGRDKNGCVYWLQVDHEANLCLYKEDQDEETWQLVARSRDELVTVIAKLKSGEEICPLILPNVNEDSSSAEVPPQFVPPEPSKSSEVEEEENEEEFLSPESESEPEGDENKETETDPLADPPANLVTESQNQHEDAHADPHTIVHDEPHVDTITKELEPNEGVESKSDETQNIPESNENKILSQDVKTEETDVEEQPQILNAEEQPQKLNADQLHKSDKAESPKGEESLDTESKEENEDEVVGEAIEEPVMVVTGEGNGAECESSWADFDCSYIIGEEISEPVMYFCGEGWGYDNDTGNPETTIGENSPEENSAEENGNDECHNGEHINELSNSSNKSKLAKNVNLSSISSVTKRSLKKQSNDIAGVLKPGSKKHCVRDLDQPDGSNSTKKAENDLKREASVNDKDPTDSDSPKTNNVKKGRSKVKKKATRKWKNSEIVNSETDNCHDNKTSIIEKRKSSVSSVDFEDTANTENEKEKSPDKEVKVEDPLPPKKLRLETTPESDASTHSKELRDSVDNKETKKDIANNFEVPITQRKKIKANKGKFKRKKVVKDKQDIIDKNSDKDTANDNGKKECKSLKRSLLDTTISGNNKSESQSESEDNEPITSGKRLKIKPKKIITSNRKKVEAKLQEKQSSDESEEETLYSIAGKKTTKKLVKKKNKVKVKEKQKSKDEKKSKSGRASEDELAPVRQSRRIAQMKIKEEAERRHMEEVALREMKKIHKKKSNDDEEEDWVASCGSSGAGEAGARRRRSPAWRSDSTGPEPDSDSDEPLFELHERDEPDPDFNKSDHEFSPESDLESGEPVEPLKRARTLQEEKDDGYCKRCNSAEQPEWILLCDKCDAGYHASCLKPVLFVVPEGLWFCPPCNHEMLIASLEAELVKLDELVIAVEAEKERKKQEESDKQEESEEEKKNERQIEEEDNSDSGSSSCSSSSGAGAVYRLRARKQLPVSYRSQEYDRLISSAIKEEYVEATTSAGNQGRGKDISTIIEAAEEEKLKAEREAMEQGKPIEKKSRKKQRRKPRKLNSLEVPSEDDDETDEDFKDTGMESSSEEISSSAERDSSCDSRSSDSIPLRRACRSENKKDRPKMTESSPEVKKKKKGIFEESSSESAGAKEWSSTSKPKPKSKFKLPKSKRRDKSKKKRKRSGLTQYDAEGNVIRARVTYGGLSGDEGENDWSPKHRTRQKKINYTEMPNTESEDEMHKSSGKHMPDSSDEYKIDDSDTTSDSDNGRKNKKNEEVEQTAEEKRKALCDLIKKTAVVPLEKLPEDVTKAKTEELQAHLNELAAQNLEAAACAAGARAARGRGGRGARGGRSPRGGRARGGTTSSNDPPPDDALAKLIGVKIKDLRTDGSPVKPNQAERERKRQEREAKQAEREAKRVERLQKKEEKEKMKEQKAKEREEKRLARLALQETKRIKREKMEYVGPAPVPFSHGPHGPRPHHPGFGSPLGPHGPPGGPHGPSGGPHGPPGGPHGPPGGSHGSPGGPHGLPGGPHGPPGGPHGPPGGLHGPSGGPHGPPGGPRGPPGGPHGPLGGPHGPPGGRPGTPGEMRDRPPGPRLQVRMELRGVLQPRGDHPPNALREGTLSVAGSPQPFKPITEEPSIITRMPHMINQQYRGPMMYPGGGSPYGPRPPQNMSMYPLHGALGASRQYPPQYYQHMRGLSSHPAYSRSPYSGPSSPAPNNAPHAMTRPHGPIPGHGPTHGPLPPGHGPPGHGPPSGHGLSPPGHGPAPGHGPSPPGHGHMNLHRPHAPGPPPLPPTTSPHGPSNSLGGPGGAAQLAMLRGPPPGLGGPPGPSNRVPPAASPSGPPRSTPPIDHDPPVRIKAEVKTEPEAYRSPTGSPAREPSPLPTLRDEPPRHPKIKVTENKDRRPRFPLGPYAPQYGPYGPYAPAPGPAERGVAPPRGPPPLHLPFAGELRPRSPAPERTHPLELSHGPYLPAHLRPVIVRPPPFGPAAERASPAAATFGAHYPEVSRASPAERGVSPQRLETLAPIKPGSPVAPPPETLSPRPLPPGAEPDPGSPVGAPEPVPMRHPGREEGSVFGGLVSYFSSQHEDDIDA